MPDDRAAMAASLDLVWNGDISQPHGGQLMVPVEQPRTLPPPKMPVRRWRIELRAQKKAVPSILGRAARRTVDAR